MHHNLTGFDVAFDGFHKKFERKLGVGTYLLFLHTKVSAQQIFLSHGAYFKSVLPHKLILHDKWPRS